MMEDLVAIVIPLGICVALPVLIVWLVSRTKINYDNRRSEILLEAIKNGAGMDADKLAQSLTRQQKTEAQRQATRLLLGCIFTFLGVFLGVFCPFIKDRYLGYSIMLGVGASLAVGISYLIVYYTVGKNTSKES